MSTITLDQVEPLFRQLPWEQRMSLFVKLIREADPDDERLEDLEDILFLQQHRHEDDEVISLDQLEENLRAKGLL